MDDERLREMRRQYANIPIPKELNAVVRKAMARETVERRRTWSWGRIAGVAAAAAVLLFVVSINALPAFAESMQDVPVLGSIVRVLTFTHLGSSSESQAYDVQIDVPEIQGLGNTELQESLNAKYLADAQARYEQFMAEIGGLENGQLAHQALDAGYKVKVQNGALLVIEHWVVETMASGVESVQYDNIDTAQGLLLTLPGLFRDDSYVQIISAYILEQMKAQMAADPNVKYFIAPEDQGGFQEIAPDQDFYINENNRLVIVFDEYAVAPGVMGVVEFEIPTEVIASLLVGTEYVH